MSSSELISIIIPVYNPGKLFIKCIESCINQTYCNLEIILVDDCSTDPYTIELLEHYAKQDSRIRILRPAHNIGQGAGRNLGEEACHGAFFTFLDNDDSLALNFIEQAHAAIVQHQADVAIADVCYYGDDDYYKAYEQVSQHSLFNRPLPFNQKLYFAPLLQQGGFYLLPWEVHAKLFNTARYRQAQIKLSAEKDQRSVEDILWFTQVQTRLESFCLIPKVGMFRLMHFDSDGAKVYNTQYEQRYFKANLLRYQALQELNLAEIPSHKAFFRTQLIHGIWIMILSQKTYTDRRRRLVEAFNLLKKWTNESYYRFNPDFDLSQSANWVSFYEALFWQCQRHQFWWVSLPFTHDSCNAVQVALRHLMAGLTDMGCQLTAISAPFCAQPAGGELFKQLLQQQAAQLQDISHLAQLPELTFNDHAIDCHVLNLKNKQIATLQDADLAKFVTLFNEVALNLPKPDAIFVSGSDPLSLALFSQLKQSGYKLIYVACGQDDGFAQLVDQGHNLYELFDYSIALTTEAAQAAQSYFAQPLPVLGWLVRSSYVPKPKLEQKCVLVPSVALNYGFAMVVKLALSLKDEGVKFLLVMEPNNTLQQDLISLHYADGTKLISTKPNLANLEMVKQPYNMDQLYDRSGLVLLPALAQKNHTANAALTTTPLYDQIAQALVFSVPVITTNLAPRSDCFKQINYLQAPASTSADYTCLPSDDEVAPWVAAIRNAFATDVAPLVANINKLFNTAAEPESEGAHSNEFSGLYDLASIQDSWRKFLANVPCHHTQSQAAAQHF